MSTHKQVSLFQLHLAVHKTKLSLTIINSFQMLLMFSVRRDFVILDCKIVNCYTGRHDNR